MADDQTAGMPPVQPNDPTQQPAAATPAPLPPSVFPDVATAPAAPVPTGEPTPAPATTPPQDPAIAPAATPTPAASEQATTVAFDYTPEQIVEMDLFDLLGLQDLSEEEKDQQRQDFLEIVRDRVLVRISDILPPEEFERFKTLAGEDGNDDAVDALLKQHDIDINRLTIEETILHKTRLVEAMKQASQQSQA